MKSVRTVELLAPAKNLETGIEAINHGADAVYIGAGQFSARYAAGNTVEDIRKLVDYAHIFHAKVYVALNVILKDSELETAENLIWEIYRAGADAIIIQDMGILNLDIPAIAFHASTQTDNRSVEKVRFLEETGFSQVVLARELSTGEIKEIAAKTKIKLEVFVHGALCASFSGQCYISQAFSQRSANRGKCAQFCRLPYTLRDANKNVLAGNQRLLSLKDLNLSEHLEELLDAGVSSFKIEGRLKDISYVKNVTAYYRKKLDEIFARRPEYRASSSGKTIHYFIPDLRKSFNRDFTDYFLHGRKKDVVSSETPKSLGDSVGNVKDLDSRYFTLQGTKPIHNGDGLCFINEKKELQGFRVNCVEGNKIFPAEMPRLNRGVTVFRNYDFEFEKILSKKSSERKIDVEFVLEENNFGFTLFVIDADLYYAAFTMEFPKEIAKKNQHANIYEQLSKLGNTPFELTKFSNLTLQNWFIPSSLLSEMKRKAIEALLRVRKIACNRAVKKILPSRHIYPEATLTYAGNVANEKAREFYLQHGVKKISPAFELEQPSNVPIMSLKYCIKYQLGYCSKAGAGNRNLAEPLTISTGKNRMRLKFDCLNCIMEIIPV
ncbi:MAG: U32 family peptidase [Dysgonamonadaceae bacterium]|jgi:putative protease|nr:U32 family peptidase [Dysgonamonadaceae bacterium]